MYIRNGLSSETLYVAIWKHTKKHVRFSSVIKTESVIGTSTWSSTLLQEDEVDQKEHTVQ